MTVEHMLFTTVTTSASATLPRAAVEMTMPEPRVHDCAARITKPTNSCVFASDPENRNGRHATKMITGATRYIMKKENRTARQLRSCSKTCDVSRVSPLQSMTSAIAQSTSEDFW